jgi:hypothetical protein
MVCLLCRSGKLAELTAEMMIHFPGLKNLDQPGVCLFPKVLVCLDCGSSQFVVSETELASIAECASPNKPSSFEDGAGDGGLGSRIAF